MRASTISRVCLMIVTNFVVSFTGNSANVLALTLPASPMSSQYVWSPTGQMTTARAMQTATVLPNGQVLVAGGLTNGCSSDCEVLISSELFDPRTGSWTATGSMTTQRYADTATLLNNGQVLVAGGSTSTFPDVGPFNCGYLSSAELYNPITEAWTPTGSMLEPTASAAAILLRDGEVLVAGGVADTFCNATPVTTLYNPKTGTWRHAGPLPGGRFGLTLTLLENGQVLEAGGADGGGEMFAHAQLFSPETNLWQAVGALATPRINHTATLLANGDVLVAGGADSLLGSDSTLASAELYHPSIGTWTLAGTMTTPREFHTATLLPNGAVLVSGGMNNCTNQNQGCTVLNSAEVYNPTTNTWKAVSSLSVPRAFHTASLIPGYGVLVAGGGDQFQDYEPQDVFSSAEVFTSTIPLVSR